MTRRPKVQEYIWRSGVIQSAVYREWLTRNSQMSADVAMAHLFCEIYKRFSAVNLVQHNSCEMPLTQEMLADALGLTGVHVNRVLQQLRETGMVDHRAGRLFMHDFNRLTSFADFDPSYLHLKNGRARSHI
jgi:CRP-like cAMP-binding protein